MIYENYQLLTRHESKHSKRFVDVTSYQSKLFLFHCKLMAIVLVNILTSIYFKLCRHSLTSNWYK